MIEFAPATLAAAERVALFIGNNDYQFARKLKNPIRDASGLETRLKAAGYRTFFASDATVEGMTTQLELFYEAAKGAEIALLFYAGHGLEAEEKNYLLPVDARLSIDESLSGDALTAAKRTVLKRETVPLEGVLKEFGTTGAKLKLIVLDCCRDDPLPDRSWLSRTAGGGGTLAEVGEKDLAEGTMLVFSTEPGKRASDGASGGHSPFTGAVIESLAPGASILGVFTGAAGRMQQQEPWIKFDGSGKAMLGFGSVAMIPGAAIAPTPTARPAPPITPLMRPGGTVLPGPSDLSSFAATPTLPRAATKEKPFVNSLGMKFVPVVKYQDGTQVHFCIWETRVQDYAAYAAKNAGVDAEWKDYEFKGQKQGPEHPVVNVSHDDAKAFCAWLTRSERAAGRIGPRDEYRLPTDTEWSYAVGIGDREDAQATPAEKDDKLGAVYPWGTTWPPPVGAGNFCGEEAKSTFGLAAIDGYRDPHAFTAPVGSYATNGKGLYDLSGNVWEWCEDWYDPTAKEFRVVRGGSWFYSAEVVLRSSSRDYDHPTARDADYGFRLVVVAGAGG